MTNFGVPLGRYKFGSPDARHAKDTFETRVGRKRGRLFAGAHCPAGTREIRGILLTPLFGRPAGDPTGDGQLVNLVAEFAISRGKVIVGHLQRGF